MDKAMVADHPAVYFVQEPQGDVLAHSGGSAYLNCSAAASDGGDVTFVWRKNGRNVLDEVDAADRVTVLPSGSLLIAPVLRRHRLAQSSGAGWRRQGDEGLYQCVAQHRLGSIVSHPARLRLASIFAKFSRDPEDVVAVAGQSVRFSCSVRAWPVPLITWYKDGQLLHHTDDRYFVLETVGVLQILAVVMSDEGVYSCLANNEAGEKWSHGATLTVLPAALNQHISAELVAGPSSYISAQVETNVSIECFVTGLPRPAVTWTKQDNPGAVSFSGKDRVHTDRVGTLHIEHIAASDSGVYTCTWTDKVTTTSSTTHASITVLVAPMPVDGKDLLAPVTRGHRRQTILLQCRFDGHPLPQVTWLKNGSEMPEGDPRIHFTSSQNGTSQLSLTSATLADSGMYQCQASNPAGVYISTTWVTVQRTEIVLRPPIHLTAATLSSSAIRVTWQDAPGTNSSTVICYSVNFYPTLLDIKELQQVVKTREQTLKNLRPSTNYTIYVVAYTHHGLSEPSQSITAVTADYDMPLQCHSTVHGVTTSLNSTVTSSGMNAYRRVQQNAVLGTWLPDQQLGIIIGSCIGLISITVSILIVCLQNRCCGTLPTAVRGHDGGQSVANGPVESTRTNISRCQVLSPPLAKEIEAKQH